MSERYAIEFKDQLLKQFAIARGTWNFSSSYNVSMEDGVPAVRMTRGKREAAVLRWGLIPYTSKGVPGPRPLIMALAEKLESSYPWRLPWERGQRCILPALGFYKWHMNDDGEREPYFIRLRDNEVFGIAGLWDRSVTESNDEIESCALITLPANKLVYRIHNAGKVAHRMPAILRQEDYELWLKGKPTQAKRALMPYPSELMEAYRVSERVNSVRNDDAELLEPVSGSLPERQTENTACGTDFVY